MSYPKMLDRPSGSPKLPGRQSADSGRNGLEAWELNVLLRHEAKSRHHGHTSVLDLCRPQVVEARLVPHLAETKRIKEAQWWHGAELLRRVERRGRRRRLLLC